MYNAKVMWFLLAVLLAMEIEKITESGFAFQWQPALKAFGWGMVMQLIGMLVYHFTKNRWWWFLSLVFCAVLWQWSHSSTQSGPFYIGATAMWWLIILLNKKPKQ